MLERILPPTFEPRQLPAPKSRGAQLVLRYCVQCHNLPNPAMHHAAKWPAVFERMVVRMRGKGNLGELMHEMMAGVQAPTQDEAAVLLAYLQKNAQKRSTLRSIPSFSAPKAVVQARVRAVPCASRPDAPHRRRMAGGGRAHGEEHGVDEPRRRQPAPRDEPQLRIEEINAFLVKRARKG